MKSLNSQIKTVTVFPSMAAVTRYASISLPAGQHQIAFDRLPESTIEKSIQVKGFGNAILGNIKFEKVFYDDEADTQRKELLANALKAEEDIRIGTDKILRLNKEKGFLDSIVQKITSPQEESKTGELDPEKWIKMISFYQERLGTLDKDILATEKEKNKSQESYDKLKAELTKLGNPQNKKQKYRVSASVDLQQSEEISMELTYHVPGAQWQPVYDIRVNSEEKKVNLSYQALVAQNSGENWENAELKISTAKPKIPGDMPKLYSWLLEIEGSGEDYEAPAMASMSRASGAGAASGESGMKKLGVRLEVGATSVTYVIASKATIKSDGTNEKVTLLTEDFNAQFDYATVPSMQPFAYLKAKVKNHTDFQFLGGDANVFMDGNFVAVSKLKTIAPTEEFSLSLGIDEGIRVERKKLKEFDKDGGNLFSKKTTVKSFEYNINIKNFKKDTVDISVWDGIPVSPNDSIKVHLIEPSYKEDTDGLKKDKEEILTWIVKVKSGEELNLPLKFTVEFPTELKDRILGLEHN